MNAKINNKKCKEYWINKGYSESESIDKSNEEKLFAIQKRNLNKELKKM